MRTTPLLRVMVALCLPLRSDSFHLTSSHRSALRGSPSSDSHLALGIHPSQARQTACLQSMQDQSNGEDSQRGEHRDDASSDEHAENKQQQQASADGAFPKPFVWKISMASSRPSTSSKSDGQLSDDELDYSCVGWEEYGMATQQRRQPRAAAETWSWSKNFVLAHELCPWARSSLETHRAFQIFVVPVTYVDGFADALSTKRQQQQRERQQQQANPSDDGNDFVDNLDDDDDDNDEDDVETAALRQIVESVAMKFETDVLDGRSGSEFIAKPTDDEQGNANDDDHPSISQRETAARIEASADATASKPLESAAIYFVVFALDDVDGEEIPFPRDGVNNDIADTGDGDTTSEYSCNRQSDDDHWLANFEDFYSCFVDLEDFWYDRSEFSETVTLAPFHPGWRFGDDQQQLSFEKRSPYPTITIVSTDVINRAGPASTEAIGHKNEATLLEQPFAFWSAAWKEATRGE